MAQTDFSNHAQEVLGTQLVLRDLRKDEGLTGISVHRPRFRSRSDQITLKCDQLRAILVTRQLVEIRTTSKIYYLRKEISALKRAM